MNSIANFRDLRPYYSSAKELELEEHTVREGLRRVGDDGWMHGDHLAILVAAERIRTEHGDRLDREFTQCADPVAQKPVQAHTVKVNRYLHRRVLEEPGQ